MERYSLMFTFVSNMLKCNKQEFAGVVARYTPKDLNNNAGVL